MNLFSERRGAIYLFSVVLVSIMLVVLIGALVAIERTTSGNILNVEEELSYFQLECVKAIENKILSVMAIDPSGATLQSELDRTISKLREQAEERGMSQNVSYQLDFQPTGLDLSPCRVSFDVTTGSRGQTAYDRREVFLTDAFVSGDYLFLENGKLQLRFKIRPGSDETEGYVDGGAVYIGSDVVLGSGLTDYLNLSSWINATSVYSYTLSQQPGLVTLCLRNETSKIGLTKFIYVKPDEVQFQVNVEPKVSMEYSLRYGIGLTSNINGPAGDSFRIDDLAAAPLNPDPSWYNATLRNSTFTVQKANSWIVTYDDYPQPYALALILDDAEYVRFSSAGHDQCLIETPARRGRFVVNGILRTYSSSSQAMDEMRELKKLGKPPSGRTNYLEPLVLALAAKDLVFDPPAPVAGRRLGIFAYVENYGTKDAYDVVVHFYDGKPLPDKSNLLGATNITTILNGRTEICSTTWTFSKPGVHEIYAVVDPDFLLLEDPTDNVKHVPLKVYPQDNPNDDIALEALHISQHSPSPGEAVEVAALVHNNGNRDEFDVVVRLKVINAANVSRDIGSVTVPNIPLGYYVSVPISFVFQSGDERVRMSADPVENETELSNNAREAYITATGVLIVADDNVGPKDGERGSTSLSEFLAALDDPGKYHVTVWSAEEKGDPTLDVLLFFDAVAWTCGDYDGHDVETNDATTLVQFIGAGGHLVLEGEDIAYRHHQDVSAPPDNFLWNVTKSYIDSYFNASLAKMVPFDDVELDGLAANAVPQINVYPTHPVMTNLPTYLASNYTAPYPDAILPVNSMQLAVYESPKPEFNVLEDDLRSGEFSWSWASSVVSSPVLSGGTAFRSTGNNHFTYTFPYTVGDGPNQYRFIDVWFYFRDSDADILLQVRDQGGSWEHRWGWDVQPSFNGYSWARKGTTLNCPWGRWLHYRLDLVTDLGIAPGTRITGLAFSADNGDVCYDHIWFARRDSWKTSMVAYENATTGSKMVFTAYPVSALENRSRKILIRNAIDWVSGRTLNRAPLLTVTAPSGAEKWRGARNITWSASDPDGDELCVDIYYSRNDGITWIDLARGLPNTGYWTWDTTTVQDGLYTVKVVADDSIVTTEKVTPSFEIDNINDPPTVTVTRPNVRMRLSGTEQIVWTASDPDDDPLTYDIEWWDGSTWRTIVTGYVPPVPSSPSYDWNTRTVPDGVGYLVKVRARDGANSAEDVSDQPFSVENDNQPPTIRVVDPNGGEVWSGTKTVTWIMNDLDGAEGGAPLGDLYRDRLTATVDYNSSDRVFTGSYPPDSQGYFRNWLLVGGYSGNNIDYDYLGGESVVLPWAGKNDNGKAWWKNFDADTRIDLYSLMSPKSTVTGYGFAYVYSPQERDVKMKVGSDDGIKIWLNGVVVHRNPVWRGAAPDQDVVAVHLNQGWNRVLVKVVQGGGSWAFYFRFADLSDKPLTDLGISLDRPNSFETGKPDATGARLGSVIDLTNMAWDTTTVPNGNYTVKVTVEDGRGGTAWDSSDSLFQIQNNRNPIVTVIYPNGKEILFGNVTVVWNATDPDGDDMTFKLYYKRGAGSWNLITTITNSTWRWYLWDISGLPDSPPEYYVKVEAYDGRGGIGWDVSDDGWYIGNQEGQFGPGGPGNYTGYGYDGQIGGPGVPPGWGGGGGGGGGGSEEPADRKSLVMLLSPLGGEEWKGTKTISWIYAYFGSGVRFDVLVSRDSGSTWQALATGITSATYSWNTNNFPDSNNYRVMVRGYDSEGNEDTDSSNNFRVYNNVKPTVAVTTPNGGEWLSGIRTITWTASDPDGDGDNDPSTPYSLKFDVYYSDNSGSTWKQIATDITTTTFDWDTSTLTDGSRYRVRVVAKDGNIKDETAADASDGDFNIDNKNEAPSVAVTSPNGGEKLRGIIPIRWTASDPDADPLTFSVYYSSDLGMTWELIQGGFTATSPYTYSWDSTTVPDGTQYMVEVVASDGTLQASDASNSIFTIDNTDPQVAITDPAYPPAKVVRGTITISGTASDLGGSGLKEVQIWIRGVYEGQATMVGENNWQFTMDTRTLPEDQTVTVEAVAYDGSGNSKTASIQMKIDNVGN